MFTCVTVKKKTAEIPPKTDPRKPAVATCALASVPDWLGTESTTLKPGTNHIMLKKTTHKRSEKIHRIDVIFGHATTIIKIYYQHLITFINISFTFDEVGIFSIDNLVPR